MSGIYIPGMEMPQRDEVITIYPDGTAYRHRLVLQLRISESKAVPVPEHGRLIEKSALLDDCYTEYEDFINGKIDGKMALLNIERKIKTAPTIIPADKEETE